MRVVRVEEQRVVTVPSLISLVNSVFPLVHAWIKGTEKGHGAVPAAAFLTWLVRSVALGLVGTKSRFCGTALRVRGMQGAVWRLGQQVLPYGTVG